MLEISPSNAIALIGMVATIVAVYYYIYNMRHSKQQLAQAAQQLAISTEQLYLDKMKELRDEVEYLQREVTEVKKKLHERDNEIINIESQRVTALIRVNELTQENAQLKAKLTMAEGQLCTVSNCNLRQAAVLKEEKK